MKLVLDIRKSIRENAAEYYDGAKDARRKADGAHRAIAETERELEKARKEEKVEGERKAAEVRVKREKKWYEKFRWFFTSSGLLCIAGRDAKQNDTIYSKHMEDADLFFHADIQGAPATVLKSGKGAPEQDMKEAAQFAASYSSAWKTGAAGVDAYAVEKSQLSKHAQGGFVGQGGFAISRERKWFRDTPLGLRVGMLGGVAVAVPACFAGKLENEVSVSLGANEKGKAGREIAKMLGAPVDEMLQILPSGFFRIKKA